MGIASCALDQMISSSRIVHRHALKTAVENVLYDAMFDELRCVTLTRGFRLFNISCTSKASIISLNKALPLVTRRLSPISSW